jgi:hypothetical protein
MSRPTPRVHLIIDRLVLRGIAPEQRAALVGALETALRTELGTAAGAEAPLTGRSLAFLRLPQLRFAGSEAPSSARIGEDAGRALGRGVRS